MAEAPLPASVSRETLLKLQAFEQLVQKWNKRINLISSKSPEDIWSRHIVDCLELVELLPDCAHRYADLGSGGGFPGLVVAICRSDLDISLVESDQRKAAFLRTVRRELGLSLDVVQSRIERVDCLQADVITARALAPMNILLEYVEHHTNRQGQAFLMKGEVWQSEVDVAKKNWSFRLIGHPSSTFDGSVILQVKDVESRKNVT